MRSLFKVTFLREQVLPALICFGLALLLSKTEIFERVDNVGIDQLTILRSRIKPTKTAEDLAVLGIDETSIQDPEFGRWPWKRSIHGEISRLLGFVQPGVVAWDILFTEPGDFDEQLIAGIVAGKVPVVLGAMRAEEGEGVKPDDEIAKTARLEAITKVEGDRSKIASSPTMLLPTGALSQITAMGFVDTPPGIDGVRRKAPLIVRIGDQVYPTLSLRSLMQYWRAKPENIRVVLGEAVYIDAPLATRRIPIDQTGAYRINYRHALDGFINYGYSMTKLRLQARFLERDRSVEVPPLTGKIVLVGQVADGLADLGPTPFSPLTPLVLVHGNVIENVLQEDYPRYVRPVWIWVIGFLLGVAGLQLLSKRKLRDQTIFSLGIPALYLGGAGFAWIQGSWLLPLVGPVFGFGTLQVFMIGRRVLAEQRSKEQIKGMFGAYISPQLVKNLVDAGQMPQLGGHDAEITAYFSDIQGFSTFSEKLKSGPLVELMNEYLTACTDIVQEEGGTLDKYIGDAVVAMFGAPVPMKDHAFRACVATQRVHLKLGELREKWRNEGDKWPEIVWKMQSRIGLNTGVCMIGNMGSRTRFNYTMMGDDVNLAARMESGAKSWGCYTMCTEATKRACEEHGGDRVVFRPLGRIVVKGRTIAVPIYEIVGLKENVSASTRECVSIFAEAMQKYYARDWDGALGLFAKSQALEPNVPGKTPGVSNNPSLVYLDITQHYKEDPPAETWDGVYVMKEK